MTEPVNYDRGAQNYRQTRTVGPQVLEVWRVALAPHFDRTVERVVDVGAGTGQFSGAIADWFDVDVVAAEPSQGMRQTATDHHRVYFVAGCGEALSLATHSVHRAWLSGGASPHRP